MPDLKIILPKEICDDYKAGTPMKKIALKHGVSYSTVRNRLMEFGVEFRTISQALKVSTFDWVEHGRKMGKLPATESAKAKLRALRLAAPAVGYSLKPNGYYEYTNGKKKGKMVHRVVAESMIGRPLRAGEVVHHKDRNKLNNDPSNLEVMTRSKHTSLHRREGW